MFRNFGNFLPCQNERLFISSCTNLEILLVVQTRTWWRNNGARRQRSGMPPKVVRLFRKIPFDSPARVSSTFHAVRKFWLSGKRPSYRSNFCFGKGSLYRSLVLIKIMYVHQTKIYNHQALIQLCTYRNLDEVGCYSVDSARLLR